MLFSTTTKYCYPTINSLNRIWHYEIYEWWEYQLTDGPKRKRIFISCDVNDFICPMLFFCINSHRTYFLYQEHFRGIKKKKKYVKKLKKFFPYIFIFRTFPRISPSDWARWMWHTFSKLEYWSSKTKQKKYPLILYNDNNGKNDNVEHD